MGVTLSVETAPVVIETDRAALVRVLDALVGNAIRFNRRDGHVRIAQIMCDGMPAVQVHDTGIGMSAAQLAAPGDGFPAGNPLTARPGGGTGLGLAVSRLLLGQLGGRLDIASQPGEGTTVTVVLKQI
jgi:signal transduction histidine kinase